LGSNSIAPAPIISGAAPSGETGASGRRRSTIYCSTDVVRIAGGFYDQVTYVWRYAVKRIAGGSATHLNRGLRVTLGADGFPIVFEVLGKIDGADLVFVSESFEERAGDRYGDVHPQRRFAVERSVEQTPDVVVGRVVADGPIPMGPYVYMSGRLISSENNSSTSPTDHLVTNIHCRCSPSQFDEIVETYEYDLVSMDGLNASERKNGISPVEVSAPVEFPAPFVVPASRALDEMLRWPVAPDS
jgi:hypothetical protein